MSSLGKIRKNINNFEMNRMFLTMTPEKYKELIKERDIEHNKKILELENRHKQERDIWIKVSAQVMAVEMLNEFLKIFDKESDYFKRKNKKRKTQLDKDVIFSIENLGQEIYENALISMNERGKENAEGKCRNLYEPKKKLIEETFNIKFE